MKELLYCCATMRDRLPNDEMDVREMQLPDDYLAFIAQSVIFVITTLFHKTQFETRCNDMGKVVLQIICSLTAVQRS